MSAPKKSKAEVGYSHGKDGKYCGICEHFQMPSRCELVAGAINRMDWCKLFKLAGKGDK